ncbi:hypothetical protein CR970_03360 [Candidatus Saccharibacteria bacterium]|nr:MAG: hypothetical protein CR970_03360 [Candidatus Saccharibacteria bacterium]
MDDTLYETAARYLELFPSEYDAMRILRKQISDKEDIGDRKNFTGHVTGSGIVIHDNHILLVFHNKLQKFLQPGGHYENDRTVAACAQREVEEETGVGVKLHNWHVEHDYVPIHIDTHRIPENKEKNEDAHYHHDHAFIFTVKSKDDVSLQKEEVGDYKWISIDTDFEDDYLKIIARKIKYLSLN